MRDVFAKLCGEGFHARPWSILIGLLMFFYRWSTSDAHYSRNRRLKSDRWKSSLISLARSSATPTLLSFSTVKVEEVFNVSFHEISLIKLLSRPFDVWNGRCHPRMEISSRMGARCFKFFCNRKSLLMIFKNRRYNPFASGGSKPGERGGEVCPRDAR